MKLLLIKLGALGDVLRTTPLLTALYKKFPDAHITWLVDAKNRDVLEGNPLISELLSYSDGSLGLIERRSYDLIINLDKEPEALNAVTKANGSKKMGFIRDADGLPAPADDLSAYAYRLGVDDELKFRQNRKTYQQISFEQVGLTFNGEPYLFSVKDADRHDSDTYLRSLSDGATSANRPIVGLNTGSGWRFAGKKLPEETYVSLARKLYRELGASVWLLGGEDELERNRRIERSAGVPITNTGSHTIGRFAAIVQKCQLVITGDTTAMHIAIAVRVPVLVHFGSTCASEIELYGKGRKIISGQPCAPCYKRTCPIGEACMREISADKLIQESKEVLSHETASVP